MNDYEIVTPKEPISVDLAGRWKVTARYCVRVDAKTSMPCVRVRGPGGVMHFARDEFDRLFEPEKEATNGS